MKSLLEKLQKRPPVFWLVFHVILAVIVFSIFAKKIVVRFDTPLVGYADTENWEYTGYYLMQNLHWNPLPNIDINNNDVFYPYGVKQIFLPWCPERDYFYAVFKGMFGQGPWLQFYFLLSRLIIGTGSFLLLRREFGWKKALFSSYLLVLFDFYTIHKWPGHVSQSIHHWVMLGVIVDFILIRKYFSGKHLSVAYLFLRYLITVFSFGLDIGYIAGYGLLSLTLTMVSLLIGFAYNYLMSDSKLRYDMIENVKNEIKMKSKFIIFILLISIVPAFLFIPIVYQIASEALSINWDGFTFLTWYSSPLRLLVPMFTQFHPFKSPFESVFSDNPEGVGAGSPGLFLILLAVIGLWHSRKLIQIYIPFLILFIMFLIHNPDYFPVINYFPWSRYARVASRFTTMYPVLLIIFATGIDWNLMWKRSMRYVTIALLFLGIIEMRAAYRLHQDYAFRPDSSFYNYMNTLKKLPGEAVLDWPFCIWDAGKMDSMCPYVHRNSGTYALRRFHEKKVIGQFFGRLHPDDIKPLKLAGWEKMFHPPDKNNGLRMREDKCFSSREWHFFDDFFRKCDFAAINLYSDIIADGCREQFVKRYGEPVAQTTLPRAGKLELFVARPSYLNEKNVKECKSLRLNNYK